MSRPVHVRILAGPGERWTPSGQCFAGDWSDWHTYVWESPVDELREAVRSALTDLDGLTKRSDVAERLRAALKRYDAA